MANYWEDSAWIVKAVQAELSVRPLLTRRRWTDKDIIAANAVYWPEWSIIPKGEKFAGERALRVFFKVEDFSKPEADPTRIVMKPPDDAILVSTISVEDARQADIVDETNNDAPLIPVLVVPVKFFVWVAGALGFDKKVLLTLSRHIMERCLVHDDADIWPEIVWITPLKVDERAYYYAVLPLVGMGGVIDPVRGNPGIYAPIQPDPYRHIVWQVVDEIIDGGTSAWGTGAASGDGAATIFAIKLRLVNFLRDLADKFRVEELMGRKRRRGVDISLSDILKAFGDGLFRHLPESTRIRRENALLKWWYRKVYLPRLWRLSTHGVRGIGYSEVARQTADGLGEWAGSARADLITAQIFAAAYLCERFGEMSVAAREEGTNVPDADRQEHALKAYWKGSVTPQEAWEIGQKKITLPGVTAGAPTEDDLYQKWLRNFEPKLAAILGPGFHI